MEGYFLYELQIHDVGHSQELNMNAPNIYTFIILEILR